MSKSIDSVPPAKHIGHSRQGCWWGEGTAACTLALGFMHKAMTSVTWLQGSFKVPLSCLGEPFLCSPSCCVPRAQEICRLSPGPLSQNRYHAHSRAGPGKMPSLFYQLRQREPESAYVPQTPGCRGHCARHVQKGVGLSALSLKCATGQVEAGILCVNWQINTSWGLDSFLSCNFFLALLINFT